MSLDRIILRLVCYGIPLLLLILLSPMPGLSIVFFLISVATGEYIGFRSGVLRLKD